jgi:hypothetical protein
MSAAPPERFRIEADADQGVTSRVLDLLSAADRFPQRMQLDRDGPTMTLNIELEAAPACRLPVAARIGQIPGVRKVVAMTLAVP